MAWHNLSKLVDLIIVKLRDFGHSECKVAIFDDNKRDCIINKEQSGVIRTNCIDCLDRTNVVQSVIARNAMLYQLYEVKRFFILRPIFALNQMEILLRVYPRISKKLSGTFGLKMLTRYHFFIVVLEH